MDLTYLLPLDGGLEVARAQPLPAQPPVPSTVDIWAPWYTGHLEITVRVGPTRGVQMQLGLGRDGRVAAEIIRSIHTAPVTH